MSLMFNLRRVFFSCLPNPVCVECKNHVTSADDFTFAQVKWRGWIRYRGAGHFDCITEKAKRVGLAFVEGRVK